ncbi:hypothetical protein [Novosphingobium sp. Leaf2]|uniref:hypothetical protein n=1 Tax=Novosphingobium sp. Leaf2 TaxID=1735670 RepID=UPI0012E1B33B|nr:hypothetical protein [Novosphingobium sp. Leaf2]
MREHSPNEAGTSAIDAAVLPRSRNSDRPANGEFRSQHRHKQLIGSIVGATGAETKCFWRSIRELTTEEGWWDAPREQPFRPDAFKIDRHARTVEIHEAVVTHPPSRKTLLSMGAFWFAMDCEEWDVLLFLHRPDQTRPAEINLGNWYYEALREHAAAPVSAEAGEGAVS